MAKILSGAELASFIKERQAKQVRNLRQAHHIIPKLAVLMTPRANQVIGVYVRNKQAYASDIGIETIVEIQEQTAFAEVIQRFNNDSSVQGVIVQLPLDEPDQTDELMNLINPAKDVDGLGDKATHISATADAIHWLCAGYGIELPGARIAVVGQGKLVGKPLTQLWQGLGYDVTPIDVDTVGVQATLLKSDIIVSAVGSPRLVTSQMVKPGAIVIDAGTSSENGAVVGDVDDAVRERADVSVTPTRGGVGPLTVALLFDHLIQACTKSLQTEK